ncbi:GAF and ANTAR domain-containing protein [Kribbella sp. NPDC004138]
MDVTRLFEAMERVAGSLRYPVEGDDAAKMLTLSAVDTIDSIDHASISVTAKDGRIQTLAPTDEVVARADALQYELGQGPCIEAALDEPVVQVDDLFDDPRWPVFGPKVAETLGLRAQVAFQFRADPQVRGALNLYANRPHSIGSDDRLMGMMFAKLAAVALGWTRDDASASATLDSREEIGKAVGIVMERYRVDPDRAFAILVHTSQSHNIKLRKVAADIVAEAARRPK